MAGEDLTAMAREAIAEKSTALPMVQAYREPLLAQGVLTLLAEVKRLSDSRNDARAAATRWAEEYSSVSKERDELLAIVRDIKILYAESGDHVPRGLRARIDAVLEEGTDAG